MSGIPVFSAGVSLQSSGVSVSAQIPADSAGMLPLFVRVTATAAGYFRLSQDGASASIGDLLIQPSDGLILKTCGLSQFSFVSQSGASTVTVTPIDVGGIKYPTNIFTPGWLFTTGVNGAWYDPSDFSTMFQDAAGTTPVTAVGQPVGRILDKSGRGNHAFNGSGNSANFPVLSARYNLLTKTEDFSDAAWTKTRCSINANAITAPDGTLTADKLIEDSSASTTHAIQSSAQTLPLGNYTGVFYGKAAERTWAVLGIGASTTGIAYFDLLNGLVGTVTGGYTASIQSVGNGWFKCTLTGQAAATLTNPYAIYTATGNNGGSYTGDGTSGVYIWGADLRVANDALNQPAYQRVNTATDYDTVGFKPYLSFNGVNQWLQTNLIDFTYGDKMFVSAGVRKLSDSALGSVVGLTTNIASNNGAFRLAAPGSAAPDLAWSAKGTTQVDLTSTTYTAPITSIISGTADIAGSSAVQRINGAQTASSASSLGTGNFSNAALYLGATGGASNWLNGRLYGLVVAGKQASASEIASTEAWLNQKTGAF